MSRKVHPEIARGRSLLVLSAPHAVRCDPNVFRKFPMSLRATARGDVPTATASVARAVIPYGSPYLLLSDRLGFWLGGTPPARTRRCAFVRLMLVPAAA